MPAHILGQRLDRDIDAVAEGLEVVDAPGIVHQHLGPAGMCDGGECRDVLHFEGMAAGALGVEHARVRAEQRGDRFTRDGGVVIGGLDAEALHHALGKVARGAIGAIEHQAVVAGTQIGQQRHGHGGKPGAEDGAARAALDLGDHVLEHVVGRPALRAVGHHLVEPALGGLAARFAGGVQHGGAAMDARVHEAMRVGAGAAAMGHAGAEAVGLVSHDQVVAFGVSGRSAHSVQEPS